MNIIYIVPFGGIGGAEKIAYNLAKYFSKKNNVSIIFLKGPLDEFYKKNDGIKKYVLDMDSVSKLPKAFMQIKKIFINEKPDLVHTHIFYSHVLARLLKSTFNYKLISSEHGSITSFRSIPFYHKILNNMLKRFSDFNSNVCKEAVDSYIDSGFYRKNELFPAYNGIESDLLLKNLDINYLYDEFSIADGVIKFIAVGRLYPEKNFELLIRAFHKVINGFNLPSKLILVGDGILMSDLRGLVHDLKLNDHVIFTGKRRDIAQLMQFSDVYCLSSNFEGLPTVLIEAVFSKLNVVSTKCCGVKEILGDYQNCSEINNIDDFAFNMYSVSKNEDNSIVENRYERAKQLFSIEAMTSFWEKKYYELLNEK